MPRRARCKRSGECGQTGPAVLGPRRDCRSFGPQRLPSRLPGAKRDGDGGSPSPRGRAGMRTPTRPVQALRLPEAEGKSGLAWAAASEEAEVARQEEGKELLAAARAAAARGEPAATVSVQARGRSGRPHPRPPLRPAGPARRSSAPGRPHLSLHAPCTCSAWNPGASRCLPAPGLAFLRASSARDAPTC